MELVVIPKSIEELRILKQKNVKTFIVGLKDFSVNYLLQLQVEEIEELLNDKDIEIFVSINKNIMNSELSTLEMLLVKLNRLRVKGILFYDLAVLSIKKRLNLDVDLVWNQTHMVTNYNTCNYYYDKGVNYAFLSNEITLDEMIEIKKNSKIKTFTLVVGYPIMAHSKRTLVTNFYKSINQEKDNNIHTITDEISKSNYLIKEDNSGTSILYGNIINGISAIPNMILNNFDYIVVDSSYIEFEKILEITDIIRDIIDLKEFNLLLERANNIINTDTCFFYKKTIYKVKKNG